MPDPNETRSQVAVPASPEATGPYGPLDSAAELVGLLDHYLADLQAGKAPDRAKLLADHPNLAAQLEQCLSGIEFVHRAAKPQQGTPTQLGDFRIVREVGRGGMGVVYEAEQLSLKRKVALKVLRFGAVADQEVMQRFQREAETVAHLHHTNIVPIHAVGCEQGVHYYAMQFIEGHSLADVIGARGASKSEDTHLLALRAPSEFSEIARWGLQAAEALAHAHQRGVIHRDIKPSNLILDPEGTVWLTDFGLAKRADEVTLTAAGVLMGTPRYMSPEQAASAKQPIDHRTDIYSLGATLYELATGKPVFDARTPQGVITQILNAEPVAPRLIQGRMPRDLETIILKCLAKEPGKRYQQARDLADDLRAFLENRAIKARRVSLLEKAVRWSRKKRGTVTVAATAVAASILVLVGGILGWLWYRQAQLGQVNLTSNGPTLVGEILDDEDQLVVPSFSVPTATPLSVPRGNYWLRLSGSGMLSETWPLEVRRGEETGHSVSLQPRWLWTPLEIKSGARYETVDLERRSDLLLISLTERSVRRLGGVAGAPLWEKDFVFDAKNVPAGMPLEEWQRVGQQPYVVPVFHDLNGDGVRDIVLASQAESPVLAALSGKDGSLLWSVRGRGDSLPELPDYFAKSKPRVQAAGWGRVIGQPGLFDVDGAPVIVAAFANYNIMYVNDQGGGTQQWVMWIEALSATTGQSLWRYKLCETGRDKEKLGTFDAYVSQYDFSPRIVKIKDHPIVVFTMGAAFTRLDARTGQEIAPLVDLKYLPPQPMEVVPDAGGQAVALHLKEAEPGRASSTAHGGSGVIPAGGLPTLTARSVSTGKVLWEKDYPAMGTLHGNNMRNGKGPFFLVNEQNKTGGPVCLLPQNVEYDPGTLRGRSNHSALELIDAATGQTRWLRRLWFNGSWQPREQLRFIFGPDLDGDGEREVFVAWIGEYRYRTPNDPPNYLCVEALSGKDGHTLWRWRKQVPPYSINDGLKPLLWWGERADWPQLLVPVVRGPGGQPVTYVFSSATGRHVATIPEVTEFRIADCNGDGLGDLIYPITVQGGQRLVVLPGRPAPAWQTMEAVTAAQDFDGDGFTDAFTWMARQARSGKDGHKLWPKELRGYWQEHTLALPPRDGNAAQIVQLGNYGPLVTAYSGKDLRPLWTSERQAAGENAATDVGGRQFRFPTLGWAVTRDKEPADFLFVSRPRSELWSRLDFGVISGKDGSTRWEMTASPGFDIDHRYGRFDVDDLNGNGWRDFIMWVPGKSQKDSSPVHELQALDGETGKPIWKESPLQLPANPPHGVFLWPRPLCLDWDGDGRPDIIVPMRGQRFDPNLGHVPSDLLVIDGPTGTMKAPAQRGVSNWSDTVVPLVMNWDGSGRNTLCLLARRAKMEQGSHVFLEFLRSSGPARQPIPLKNFNLSAGWNALDMDGDGKDDLVFFDDDKLWAYRGGQVDAAWSWPLEGQPGKLLHLEPANKDHPATVVVWRGRSIYGLDWNSSKVRWRAEANTNPPADSQPHVNSIPSWGMLRTDDPRFLPRFLVRYGDTLATDCIQTLPTAPTGVYLEQAQVPLEALHEVDQHFYRTLPWGHGDVYLGWYTLIGHVLFVLCLLYWALRRRWLKFMVFLGLAVALTVCVAIFFLQKDGPLYPDERYSWESWYILLYLGIGVAAVPWFLWMVGYGLARAMARLVRRRPA
jgi:serine/threonine protein kinase